jgi:glycosyltransferase involved in cell wall biosynthesis
MRIFRSLVRRESSKLGVSVIIPVRDAAWTLEATLELLVGQTHAHWEAIIIDDGSADGTQAVAENWVKKDSRFQILQQEKSGVSVARNHGLREARYPWVLFLDGDDRVGPRYLEFMAGKLTMDSVLDAVHCGWQYVLPSGATGRVHLGPPDADLFECLAWHNISQSTPAC